MNIEKFIKDIAEKAGKLTLKYFGEVYTDYQTKSHSLDILTKADLASNKFLVDYIKKQYPSHGIISEETGEHNISSKYTWIIDPIDGTLNFSRGIPIYGVLVALAINGRIELAAIADPVHKELFFAKRNAGAYLNGKRIKCAAQKKLELSVGGLSSTFDRNRIKVVNKLIAKIPGNKFYARQPFSIAISSAMVAGGRQDWHIATGGNVWDFAAPYLVLTEAGCKATNIKGGPWRFTDHNMIAANPALHKKLVKILN